MQDALIAAKSNLLAARAAATLARTNWNAAYTHLALVETEVGYVTAVVPARLEHARAEFHRLDKVNHEARVAVEAAHVAVDIAKANIELDRAKVGLLPAAPHCAIRLPKSGLVLVDVASYKVLQVVRKSEHTKYTHVSIYRHTVRDKVVGFPHTRADLAAKACAEGKYNLRGIAHSPVVEAA